MLSPCAADPVFGVAPRRRRIGHSGRWFQPAPAAMLIASQAPGLRVPRGEYPLLGRPPWQTRLRRYLLGVDEATFYDRSRRGDHPDGNLLPPMNAKAATWPPPPSARKRGGRGAGTPCRCAADRVDAGPMPMRLSLAAGSHRPPARSPNWENHRNGVFALLIRRGAYRLAQEKSVVEKRCFPAPRLL